MSREIKYRGKNNIMNIIGVYYDGDGNLTVIKDGFESKDEAQKYMKGNNFSDEEYFVGESEIKLKVNSQDTLNIYQQRLKY